MQARPYPIWISRLFIFAMSALSLTGILQMPLAKRYYLTEIPGLAWTGDFFVVHKLHYVFAALLLFTVALVVVNWLTDWQDKLTLSPLGFVRASLLGGLIVSGGFRVYRNMPDVTLSPSLIVTIEWTHLALAALMGIVALVALVKRVSAYATH